MTTQPVRTWIYNTSTISPFLFCSPVDILRQKPGKTGALFFSSYVSSSCPSFFRVFAQRETRQNKRMWDRQPWNGGRGPRGVCDLVYMSASVFHSHLSVRCVWGWIFSCLVLLMYVQRYSAYIFLDLCEFASSRLNNKVEKPFETWLHVCNFTIVPNASLIYAWTHTHTHLHVYISVLHPHFHRNSFVCFTVKEARSK